jgi:Arylsulfotransferase (ASST)
LRGEPGRSRAEKLDRREFIGTALKAGIGLAGAGLVAGAPLALLDETRASAAPSGDSVVYPTVKQPTTPPTGRRYVSRPDLSPPAVNITSVPGFPFTSDQPKYIFMAPRVTPGSTYPKGVQPGLMILDLKGDVVWFKPQVGNGTDPFNFRVQTYKKKPVLTWYQGNAGIGYSTSGEYIIADDTYSTIATVQGTTYPPDLHEFIITPQDTAYHTAYETGVKGPGGTTLIVGHAQEVDVASNDPLWDWACYPAVSTADSYVSTTGDYFHINSIDLWPGSAQNLLISGRNTSTVYLIEQSTKDILWRVSGKRSSFKMGASTPFSYQHDARALADGSGISVFDDASQPSAEKQSSGKVISLNQTTKQATLRHQYFHTDAVLDTPSQGNCQLLLNGGHMVGWGAEPYFTCYRASGDGVNAEIVLDGRLPGGVESYRTFMFDWKGNPAQDELRLVVHADAGTGNFTAWASWNGATKVSAWRLNAGPSAQSLEVIKTVEKDSFETPINFTRDGAKAFRVAALDSSGNVISRSSVVAAS